MWEEFIDINALTGLSARFGLNLFIVIVLVRYIYYKHKRKQKNFAFSFILSNTIVFFLCHMMSGAQISMGFAFGLFAVFGILRFRTTTLPVKEMTYLFIAISLALINGLSTNNMSMSELVFIDVVMILIVYVMEKFWFDHGQMTKRINYERLDLLESGEKTKVIEDLNKRTGLQITDYRVRKINLVENQADLTVVYNIDE